MAKYTALELKFFAFALSLSFLLLLFHGSQGIAAVPAFLAWLMINRKR